ncbi:MAG: exodeoxyribonuclease VII small subunit [Bdellovibrionaceae bacterium]|nr:exodeoxyribonuclease VII small subunit [Pseudobdellovibrionaceae bacterium]
MEFEKKLNRLEEIVGKMEKGDISLEDSLKFFEEGVKLSRECNAKLTEAELKVKKLMSFDKDGNPVTESFNSDNN